jgi:non-ribosomal peptide synthetase-like protein
VHYLRAIGYRLGKIIQTGSNFGATQRQDSPYLTTIGTGTMVSDALSIMNTDYSGSSFRVLPVTIGTNNYFGNDIAYPAAGRTGDNVLLATKVMVPIDGPVRENCGLLGSPPFEIPRSVMRDADADRFSDPSVRRVRVKAKNRHNLLTATLFLVLRYAQTLGLLLVGGCAIQSFSGLPQLGLLTEVVVSAVFLQATQILAERLTRGFRRLTPWECSIYDHYFWTHERLWKLLSVPVFNGTPFKNVLWRLAGVRMGKRVFDDGCSMAEKTLVTIGDDCVLNAQSTIQCHSLEDGKFKSDHIVIGSGVTLGVHAFVHYGAYLGDGSVLDTNSFLMKGEHVNPGEVWSGNPASRVS